MVLATYEEKGNRDIEHKGVIQEAILWYNRVLGFHIEGGRGSHSHFIVIDLFPSFFMHSLPINFWCH